MLRIFLLSLFIFSSGCANNINNKYSEDLKNNKWVLTYFNGEKIGFTQFEKEVFIQFPIDSENQFRGFAGCNNIFGGYKIKSDSLRFVNVASTRMSCPHNVFESRFLEALNNIDSYSVEEDALSLYTNGKKVLSFKAVLYD